MGKSTSTIIILIFLFLSVLTLSTGCSRIKSTKHFENGKRYADLKQYDRAIEEFESAVAINPLHDQAHEALGLMYMKLEQYQRATPSLEEALKLKPESKLYLMNLATTYMKLERYTDAKKLYLRVAAMDRDNELVKQQLRSLESLGY